MDTSIRISLKADDSGGKQVQQSLRDIQKQGALLSSSAASWGTAFKTAFATNLILPIFQSFAQLPGSIDSVIERGNRFNQTMTNAKNALAGVFATARPEAFRNVAAAQGAAASAVADLRDAARGAGISQAELVGTFQAATGALTRANVPLQTQISIVANATKAMSAYGYEGKLVAADIARLFNGGGAGKNRLADFLGFTTEEIKRLREGGQLAEAVARKVATLAGGVGDSPGTRKARLNDAIDEATGKVASAAMEQISQGFLDMAKAIEAIPEATLKEIGEDFAALVKAGMSLAEFGARNAAVIYQLLKWGAVVGLLAAVGKGLGALPLLMSNLGTAAAKQLAWLTGNTRQLDAETAALGRNTIAQRVNTGSRGIVGVGGVKGNAGRAAATFGPEFFADYAASKRNVAAARQAAVQPAFTQAGIATADAMRGAGGTAARQEARAAVMAAQAAQAAARQSSTAALRAAGTAGAAARMAPAAVTTGAAALTSSTAISVLGPVVLVLATWAAGYFIGKAIAESKKETADGERIERESYDRRLSAQINEDVRKKNQAVETEEARQERIGETERYLGNLRARHKKGEGEDGDEENRQTLALKIKFLESELDRMKNDPNFIQQNIKNNALAAAEQAADDERIALAAAEAKESEGIRARMKEFSDADLEKLNNLREAEKDSGKLYLEASERLDAAAKRKRDADDAVASGTANKDLAALRKQDADTADFAYLKAKKEEAELFEKMQKTLENRRRVEADLAVLSADARGASAAELQRLHAKETLTRRIFDLQRQLMAEGKKEVDARKEALALAQKEADLKATIAARQSAESLRDIYANLLVNDLKLTSATEAQVNALREQQTILSRISELKKAGRGHDEAVVIAAKEAQQIRQLEARERAGNLAYREMERQEKRARAEGKTSLADNLKSQITISKKTDEIMRDNPALTRAQAQGIAHQDFTDDAQIADREKRKSGSNTVKAGNAKKGGRRVPLPTITAVPTLAEIRSASGSEGILAGAKAQALVSSASPMATGGTASSPVAGQAPDLAGGLNSVVADKGEKLLASVKTLGDALGKQYDGFSTALNNLAEQIKNNNR